MINNNSIICIILARGGSKGFPGKNVKPLLGKPLLYYTVKAVQNAEIFDRVILSTDNEKIARIAENMGVEVPFLRPKELAQDDSSALDAIQHALEWVEQNDKRYDYVQYIFPTAPLRTSEDILNALNILFEKNGDMVISVCETDHPSQWSNALPRDNSLRGFIKSEYRGKNRQNLPKTYRINGAIYVGKWDIFYYKKDWFDQDTFACIMPRERSIDIDTPTDFKLAQLLMESNDNE